MASKIENIIDDIQAYVDECKPAKFSSNNILVNRDELEAYLEDLRRHTPEEIRRYQKIISNQENILADARRKADEIIGQAQITTNELVSEHQIMQQAYAKANEVVMVAQKQAQETLDKAQTEANEYKMAAMAYADQLLVNIETVIAHSIETTKSRNESYISTMQGYLDVVVANRAEINPESIIDEAAPAVRGTKVTSTMESDAIAAAEAARKSISNAKPEEDGLELDIPEQFFNKE